MRIDGHHHLSTLSRGDYDWLTPDLGAIYRDFTLADLPLLLDAAGVAKTILVQATDTGAETEFLLQQAEASDRIAGVVGWIDMLAPDAIDRLDRLAAHPPRRRPAAGPLRPGPADVRQRLAGAESGCGQCGLDPDGRDAAVAL